MSLSIEIIGNVHHIGELDVTNEKFPKRECVILVPNDSNPQYDDYIKMEFKGDKSDILDQFSFNDKVKVYVNLRGVKYQKKDGSGTAYFNNMVGWKIETVEKAQMTNPPMPPPPELTAKEEEQDLPF